MVGTLRTWVGAALEWAGRRVAGKAEGMGAPTVDEDEGEDVAEPVALSPRAREMLRAAAAPPPPPSATSVVPLRGSLSERARARGE
jgi:hypothetical protein